MKRRLDELKSESGVTLVELLAALAILSIIVSAFLAFFVQAGRTNNVTTSINEATFLAQEEMEIVTHLAAQGLLEDDEIDKATYTVKRVVSKVGDPEMYKVIVIVEEGGKIRAQMETRLPILEDATNK